MVSEETGSISLAERGTLYRPLTIRKLKESLEARFSTSVDREVVAPGVLGLVSQIASQIFRKFFDRINNFINYAVRFSYC